MKKQISLGSLLMAGMVVITVLMSSCVPSYKKAIPANAVSVVEVDVKNLVQKSDFMDQKESVADLIASFNLKDKTLKKIAYAIENPSKVGIDLGHPLYLFTLPSAKDVFFVAAVKEKEDILKTISSLADNFQVRTFDNVSWLYINNVLAGVVTENTLLLGNVENKLTYRHLLEQEKSFFTTKAGRWMRCHSGDVTILANMENLSSKDRRTIECTITRELPELAAELDEVLEQFFNSKAVMNLKFKSGKVALNVITDSPYNKNLNVWNKRIRIADLKRMPNENLWGVFAMGIDGNKYWDELKKSLRPLIKKMSCQEREKLEQLEEIVRAMDGTLVGSISGRKLDCDPEFVCLLPISVVDVDNVIEDYDIDLGCNVRFGGNQDYSVFTNKLCYNSEEVTYPFAQARHAFMAYLYGYFNIEPAVKVLFNDLSSNADCHEMKVYDKCMALCELMQYAELEVPAKNKLSLAVYLNDKSKNALAHLLVHGLKIGDAVVNYNCKIDASAPIKEKNESKNNYRRFINSFDDCETCRNIQ